MLSPRVPSWVVRFENAWPGANVEGKLELRGPVSSEHGWGWGEEGTAICIFDGVTYIVSAGAPGPPRSPGRHGRSCRGIRVFDGHWCAAYARWYEVIFGDAD